MARTFVTLPRWPSAELQLRRVEAKDVKLCAELEAASYPADEAMHLSVCEFRMFEKWYCISITNPKQNFPTLNELFVPGCWYFASSPTPSVSDHAMPCTRLHHLKTWHCGSERQEIIFGLRWMLGNLWKFDLYVSIKTGFDDLCFYGVQVQSRIFVILHDVGSWVRLACGMFPSATFPDS